MFPAQAQQQKDENGGKCIIIPPAQAQHLKR